MRLSLTLIPVLFVTLSACSEFPELEQEEDKSAAYPSLVPVERLNSQAPDPQIKPETAPDLDKRVDRLKRRAKRLQRDVIDDETQARMEAGIE